MCVGGCLIMLLLEQLENKAKDGCILCILDEVNHFEWRAKAQSYGSHNHQHLTNYRDIILAKLNNSREVSKCSVHNFVLPSVADFWEKSKKFVDYEKIAKEFFDTIISVYELWNEGDVVAATKKLSDIVDEIKKNSLANDDLPLFFFRERVDGESSKDGLWHIPFEDRYKVKNFRFSISGRPILYLGTSIIDIVYEMRQEKCTDKSKHMVSTFLRKQNLKIFDLTNRFPSIVQGIYALMNSGSKISFDDKQFGLIEAFPNALKLLLLMSCCSFATIHEGATFHEEYILPQMLTEILQKKGFDGIKYSSTRLNPKFFEKENHLLWQENYFRENYALFTKYNDTERHDASLKEKFENFSPISLTKKLDENPLGRLSALVKELVPYINKGGIAGLNKDLQQTLIPYFTRFDSLKCNGELYAESEYGKFEINCVISAFTEYLKELSELDQNYKPLYMNVCRI